MPVPSTPGPQNISQTSTPAAAAASEAKRIIRAIFDDLIRLRVAGDHQRVFGQQRQKRIGSIVPALFGEGEQALIESRMLLLHFLRRAPAIHAHQRDDQRQRDGRANSQEKHKTARQQARRRERGPHQRAHNHQRQQQRGARPPRQRLASR